MSVFYYLLGVTRLICLLGDVCSSFESTGKNVIDRNIQSPYTKNTKLLKCMPAINPDGLNLYFTIHSISIYIYNIKKKLYIYIYLFDFDLVRGKGHRI